MAEVGKEINIRIEISNDTYRSQGKNGAAMDEPEDMELDYNDSMDDLNIPDEISSLDPPPQQLQTIQTNLEDQEDGECSSASDGEESQDKMEVAIDRGNIDGGLARPPRQYPNPFLSEEAKKRADRARRFPDCPYKFETAVPQTLPTVSDDQLLEVYMNCGIVSDDGGDLTLEKVGPQYRLDAILIRGINNMSTEEVFSYLYSIGLVPQSMEWINDACCVVIYKDKYEAAASLLVSTKPIEVDPQIMERKKSLLIEAPETDEETVKRKDSLTSTDSLKGIDYENATVIPHEKVTVPMPLGYVWRYAKPCEKANGVLMRFATTSDKKQERAEKHSEYYKRYGNPNNPNYRPFEEGYKSKGQFKRVRTKVPAESSNERGFIDEKKFNAWSVLSEDWNNEEDASARPSRAETRVLTPIPSKLINRRRFYKLPERPEGARSVFEKLGRLEPPPSLKRHHSDAEEDDDLDEPLIQPTNNADDDDDDDDADPWTSRMNGPRMRMHADEEVERVKLRAKKNQLTRRSPPRPHFTKNHREIMAESRQGHRRPIKERLGLPSPSFRRSESFVPDRVLRDPYGQPDEDDDSDFEETEDLRRILDSGF